MKYYIYILLFFIPSIISAQTDKSQSLEAQIQLPIWDIDNSTKKFNIKRLTYNQIPKYLDFRGTVVECLTWTDTLGDNILIQSLSGHYLTPDSDKWDVYVYLFRKAKNETTYSKIWRIYDFNECFGVDWNTEFISDATTITDIDNNGIAEISIPYVLICRGGMDPGTMKLIMYEDNTKYAMRGTTKIKLNEEEWYGGTYTMSDNLEEKSDFKSFLIGRWNTYSDENKIFNRPSLP